VPNRAARHGQPQPPRPAQLPRRRFLQLTGALAAGAGWASVGCKSAKDAASGATPTARAGASPELDVLNPGAAISGGRYQDYVAVPFGSFDPHLGAGGSFELLPKIYNVLVNQSPTRAEFIVLDLAQSFENPDETTWIFRLRPDARVAPNDLGVPERAMDAYDVAATLERIRSQPNTTNGGFVKDFIATVETPEPSLVRIITPRPYAWFLNRVGVMFNTIPPRELLGDGKVGELTTRGVGGGPFQLVRSADGESATFERNPNYYGRDPATATALPYIDGLDVRVLQDAAATRTAFQSGQIDVYRASTRADADALNEGGRATVAREPAFTYVSVMMNVERPPLTDARVRRAISRAIDRAALVDRIYGGEAAEDGLVPWTHGAYALESDELARRQPFDRAEAATLMAAAGGGEVRLTYPAETSLQHHDLHLAILLRQMQDAGISIKQDPRPFVEWLDVLRTRDYEMTLAVNAVYDTPELPLDFHSSRGPVGDGSAVVGVADSAIDEAIARSKATLELEARIEAVRDAQRVIYDLDPACFPLVSWYDYTLYNQRVRNIPAGIGTSRLFVHSSSLAR
jgi:peptide/nickel transport system substrate-binding protein